jgi:hypothetical protein
MNFPIREAEIRALARNVIRGMAENPDYPSPPMSTSDLNNILDEFDSSSDAQIAAKAAAEMATAAKQTALNALITALKSMLRYAELAVHGDDSKLKALGWGGRSEPTPLASPGQPRLLECHSQGEDWLILDWKRPVEGGTPSHYKIKRRELTEGGSWSLAGTATETEVLLNDQERGKKFEYQVVAVNKTGDSLPSNAVAVVL